MKIHKVVRIAALVCTCVWIARGASATPVATYSGYLDDQGNTALVYSDLSPALFDFDWEIANNVALYDLTVSDGVFVFASGGYAAGGAQPYFSLFSGSLASVGTATFVTSNFFDPNIDFSVSVPLSAGNYIVAIGVWANMSFAENFGAGTLADGFIFLGVPEFLGNSYYQLDVSTDGTPPSEVPEPAALVLLGSGLVALSVLRTRRRQ